MAEPVTRYRFTVEEFHRMGEAGIFREDDRLELIEGELVRMSPVGSRHAACVKRLVDLFLPLQASRKVLLGVQDPVRLDDRTEVYPDVSLLRWRSDYYASGHPGPEAVWLVVEVSETSLAYDREVKVPLYARAGVPEAWVVDVEGRALWVYRMPEGAVYLEVFRLGVGEEIAPQAFPEHRLRVQDILGIP
ncbi:Uma2 family endonuclease [Rhodothermus marinus]|uniref:Putative restriction endonuclease domain-containing protein n=1 Tax=Rhodothermus marinus (strain ATCC 43812 / DSM 4252 / R-10) TaxID=518766 RepID=D0MHZ2_RHOM4|nr:Uma2 family endonuclease [Rhodothermus marinus]ACY48100.1 protein of unknown function DUF820 [Rhodothermus marinus DSM 4252]